MKLYISEDKTKENKAKLVEPILMLRWIDYKIYKNRYIAEATSYIQKKAV